MRVSSAFGVPIGLRARFGPWVLAIVVAPWTLGSLVGCGSSPESMAEYRGYEYQYELAERYRLGDGVEKDPTKAAYWYYQAAASPSYSSTKVGHNGARLRLAEAYRDGEGVERDYAKALYWYTLVADKRDSPLAKYEIGELYRTGGPGLPKDEDVALKWYREAAEEGSHWGQLKLGEAYSEGRGVKKDVDQAARFYEIAALQGNRWAEYRLSEAYRTGEGKPRDLKMANEWLRKSAEQGNKWAMLKIGDVYLNGEGVAEDHDEAVQWYALSAQHGNDVANQRLQALGYKPVSASN